MTSNPTNSSRSTAIVAISSRGAVMARRLVDRLEGPVELHVSRRYSQPAGSETSFELPARPVVQELFNTAKSLILFMPVGAAVRLLASSLDDKHSDPAVVCVDDGGRFAVSLVSGHLGGADALAQEVAAALGATPVITSGSHALGVFAADMLGREFGWTIETRPGHLTRASAAVVNGEAVGLFQDAGQTDWQSADQELPNNMTIFSSIGAVMGSDCAAALIITDRNDSELSDLKSIEDEASNKAVVVYRPKTLVAGMGCRKGVSADHLLELLTKAFEANDLSLSSLSCIATADLKRDEPGLIELAAKYDVPLRCYSTGELNSVFGEESSNATTGIGNTVATARPRVHGLLGVWGVSEPAALLAAGSRELLAERIKTDRATIAIARIGHLQILSASSSTAGKSE